VNQLETETLNLAMKVGKEIRNLQSAILRRELLSGKVAKHLAPAMVVATYQCLWEVIHSLTLSDAAVKAANASKTLLALRSEVAEKIIDLTVKDLEGFDRGHVYSAVLLKRQRGLKD
jgi:hypothetical protein